MEEELNPDVTVTPSPTPELTEPETGAGEAAASESSGGTETTINVTCTCPDYTDIINDLLLQEQASCAAFESLQLTLETQNGQLSQLIQEWKSAEMFQYTRANNDAKTIIALLLIILCLHLRRMAKNWRSVLFGGDKDV